MGEAVENEFKFTAEGKQDIAALSARMEGFLQDSGVVYSKKAKRSVDSYFDTSDQRVYESDCILRRKVSENGKVKLTIKRPITNEYQMMSRQEIEVSSDGRFEEIAAFSEEYLPGLQIEEEPILNLECERIAFDYKDGSGIKLSLDSCTYVSNDHRKDFCEIELESMGDSTQSGFDSIGICDFVTKDLGFTPVTESKYRRGIQWIRGLRPRRGWRLPGATGYRRSRHPSDIGWMLLTFSIPVVSGGVRT